jgi:hypothetical protein
MLNIIFKTVGIWLVMVIIAIANGLFRDKVLSPLLGPNVALPVSGVLLAVFIFAVCYVWLPTIGKQPASQFLFIGLLWVVLTLGFEFLFGHYVVGKSWRDIVQVFDATDGNLFLLVMIVTLLSPLLAAKLRGYILV